MKYVERMTRSPLNYWFSFASDSIVAIALVWYGMTRPYTRFELLTLFIAGFLFFSLIEYVMHRWFFHSAWSPAYKSHMEHHDEPEALLALPWFASAAIAGTLFVIFHSLFPYLPVAFFVAGAVAGYVYYGLMHHVQHHYSLKRKLLLKSWAYHNIHHKLPNTNYGVTTSVWDRVFRTHYQSKR
jgi:sterol desaturase/sphingolipid hydroxylase (fatty acid hydroxylase superfamily)